MSKNQITNRGGGITYFTATNVKGELFDCLIDTVDEHLINSYTYRISKAGYLISSTTRDKQQVNFRLHREIMKTPLGLCTDHINGNRSDNRRCNLRICSNQENSHNSKRSNRNTSGYKGVSLRSKEGKWRAQARIGDREVWIGQFKCPTLAALAYDRAIVGVRGEFTRVNLEGILNG